MRTRVPPTPLRLPVFVSMFIAACSGQQAAGPATKSSPTSAETRAQDPAQIAEYVVAAFEDSKGHLWFGTMNRGVARHDGRSLTYFTEKDGLCGETIASIAETRDGALWFGGHTGICKYDGKTFTRYFDKEGSVRTDRRGNVWASTNDGVHRFDGASFTRFDIPLAAQRPATYSIVPGRVMFRLEDSEGNLWFATDGHGAIRHDGESFTQYTKQDGLCSDTVWNIVEDRQGRLWFACIQAFQPSMSGDGGLCRLDGETFTKFPDVAGLGANDIYTIYEDRAGHLWIGATGLGAYRFDGATFTLFADTDRPDLIKNKNFGLQAMVEDRRGRLWGGFSGGLFRFDGESFVNVTQDGPW